MKCLTASAAVCALLAVGAVPAHATTEAMMRAGGEGTYAITVRDMMVSLVMGAETDGMREAEITILENGRAVYNQRVGDLFSLFYGPYVRVVEMDDDNDTPEIFIGTYTGGAHCCVEVNVITRNDDGWKSVDFGAFNGDPESLVPRDLDGDGVAELETYDNRFLYQFASYAGSFAPPQILAIRDGAVADVTADENFGHVLRDALDNLGAIPESDEPRNSWLATYAALLLMLDEDDPLDYAIGAHDPSVDWGMMRCTVPEVDYSCPQGKEDNIGFEVALREFLTETGHLKEGER